MNIQNIKLPYTIRPSKSGYIFAFICLIFFAVGGPFIILSKHNGLGTVNYLDVAVGPILGLIIFGYVVRFKIVLYSNRLTYRLSWYWSKKTMFYSDIAHIERATRVTPAGPIPLLRIQNKNQKYFDIPVASFRDDDIRLIIDVVSNTNKGVLLNEWAEETKEGIFKDYYHFTKIWKQILWYGLGFAFITGIITAIADFWFK